MPTARRGPRRAGSAAAVEGQEDALLCRAEPRDERIDWMRELMLVKAERDKAREGYDVQVHRGPKEDAA